MAKSKSIVDIQLITNNDALRSVCQQFEESNEIAVDTEFKRETTYYPKACLIQIANEQLVVCIDPLLVDDLSPLKNILQNQSITKIFHAARQDLEIFYYLFNQVPSPVFDTQIAATLLGFADQVGYATLTKKMLNIELDKSLTRADWEKRPIPEKQIKYAANDVIYLLQIYHQQIQQLNKAGRLNWLNKDFEFLISEELYKPSPEAAWKKIKSFNRLRKHQRCVVYKISYWREEAAIRRNRPRNFVLKNQTIIDLANQQPSNLKELQDIRDIHPSLIKRDGEKILSLIYEAKIMDEDDCPKAKSPSLLNEAQSLLLSSLQTVVQLKAKKHNIDSSYLCTKKELEKVILKEEDASLLHGWRYELAGKDVVDFIEGKNRLEVLDGSLTLTKN